VVPIVTADKDLKSATIKLGEQTLTMRRDGDKFLLDETDEKKNPLAAVLNTTRYEVQVVDGDDLTLERPVSGVLQVRADQPPRMAAATASRYVLPNASPNIRYGAVDDYGLVSVEVVISVTRQTLEADGGSSGSEIVTPEVVPKDDENNSKLPNEIRRLIVKPENHGRDVHDDVKVSFADLGLEKGDRVTMTFVATDYRGTFPGKTTRSERIVFEVTDLEGVRAALRELDAEMDKKLDQIIKAQLGIGN
jgi:hypothetical protein